MKIKKLISIKIFFAATLLLACEDQLDVGNPNQPTLGANVTTESGLTSLAQGGVYINGFNLGDGWLGNSYFSLPYGYSELLGDVVGAQASNQLVSTLSIPDYFDLSDGTRISNPASSIGLLRSNNTRAQTGSGYNTHVLPVAEHVFIEQCLQYRVSQLDKSPSPEMLNQGEHFSRLVLLVERLCVCSMGQCILWLIIDEIWKQRRLRNTRCNHSAVEFHFTQAASNWTPLQVPLTLPLY